MTELAVQGFRAERDSILEIVKGLNDDEWNAPSDCAGWAIRDVVAHLASTLHGVSDPAFLPDMSGGTEDAMEAPVAERRNWSIEQVVAEYETSSATAAEIFAGVQAAGAAETPLDMGELGTHPMSVLPATFLFDSYCHLRHDILTPSGSVDRPEPPRDEQRLRPTVEWMLAGLPWMCPELTDLVRRPLVFELRGPGGGTWTFAPADDSGRIVIRPETAADAAAAVTSTDHAFVAWGTRRRPWRDDVEIVGDEAYAASVLGAVNVI